MRKILSASVILIVLSSLCFAQGASAPADPAAQVGAPASKIILLKSGAQKAGTLVEQTDKYITINISGLSSTYYLDEIEMIDGKPVAAPASPEQLATSPSGEPGPTIAADQASAIDAQPSPAPEAKVERSEEPSVGDEEKAEPAAVVAPAPQAESSSAPFCRLKGSKALTDAQMLQVLEKNLAELRKGKLSASGDSPACPVVKPGPARTILEWILMLGILQIKYKYFFWFLSFLGYLYYSLCMYLIAKKTNTEPAWLAWIPVVNVLALPLMIAGVSCWWLLALLLMIVPFVKVLVLIAGVIFTIYVWIRILKVLNKPWWLLLLTLIPVLGYAAFPIILGYLAFSKQDDLGPSVVG